MKRSLSGIQPSGILHIGNYFGAMKQFVDLQDSYDGFYFIADYHSLTSLTKAETLRQDTYNIVLDYLAVGLDPNKSPIYLQSNVPEHTEMTWLLSNITPVGLLERGHSYKDKIAKGIPANTGLLTYPVLMAADILIYDTDVVPVGKDQKQHLEMTRDIAMKFNQQYEVDFFKLPEPFILDDSAIVPGTDGQKMSKSYNNTINMFVTKKKLKEQVMSIAKIYALFNNIDKQNELKDKFLAGNFGYGHAKTELLNSILDYFGKAREKREELEKDMDYVKDVLNEGSKKARAIAIEKIKKAKEIVGLVGNIY